MLGSKHYSCAVDMWSIGCIIAELVTKQPLFPGDSEIDELYRVFRVLGTPTEAVWPGVSKLPDYKPSFPQWKASGIDHLQRNMDPLLKDLILKCLEYEPSKRLSAKDAMNHPYFDDIDKNSFNFGQSV